MVATAPLADHVLDPVVYARWGYEYFQQRPDGRLTLGGFGDVDGEASYTTVEEGSPAIWERLEDYVHDDLGFAGAEITHRWVGIVSYGADGRPYVGPVPGRDGLHVLGGYSGVGNLVGYVAATPSPSGSRPATARTSGCSPPTATAEARPQPRSTPREITSRWMSEVPSSISSSLASRIHFSTGYSRE